MLSSVKGELKQHDAVEAARDPNSSVSAEDAEQVILDESKKAGSAALQFDPNASPEEKAAQAASVSRMLSMPTSQANLVVSESNRTTSGSPKESVSSQT
jgi:K+-transporting ATPase c subunit